MAAALQLISDPATAGVLLHPVRMRMLELLTEPDSASGLARRLALPRQKANYHLRELEREGLVEFVEERRKGNCVERVVRARAQRYLVSPQVLGALAPEGGEHAGRDRFSAAYLVARAARAIREVADLAGRAGRTGKRLATLTIETEVRFRSAEERSAFAEELAQAVARLTAKYQCNAGEGRGYQLFAGVYPVLKGATAAVADAIGPNETTASNLVMEE
jgi:DNA-binding transcriptional ArsR family regulator